MDTKRKNLMPKRIVDEYFYFRTIQFHAISGVPCLNHCWGAPIIKSINELPKSRNQRCTRGSPMGKGLEKNAF